MAVVLHGPLRFRKLRCQPVIRKARIAGRPRVVEVVTQLGTVVETVMADDVLYLPELRLQVLNGHIVPEEGIVDPWNLQFEQSTNFEGKGRRYLAPFNVTRSDDEVCILSNSYSSNFTHFIEELFKVVILETAGFTGNYVVTDMPPFAFAFLDLLRIPRDRIDDTVVNPTRFARAAYTTPIYSMNLTTCPGVLSELRNRLFAAIEHVPSPVGSRLWLERGANVQAPHRDLVNADEVHECLERHGFERIDIGALSLEQQLAASRDAKVISGVHGSAFAHCAFMPPGSRVVECFSPLYLNGCLWETCRVLGHRYHLVVDWNSKYEGYAHGDRVHIDVSQLELAFQGLPD